MKVEIISVMFEDNISNFCSGGFWKVECSGENIEDCVVNDYYKGDCEFDLDIDLRYKVEEDVYYLRNRERLLIIKII
jgi:hypothetical protein